MNQPKCPTCPWRAKYDQNRKSLLGRLWRWHINFCPGWKAYQQTLSPDERAALAAKYQLRRV